MTFCRCNPLPLPPKCPRVAKGKRRTGRLKIFCYLNVQAISRVPKSSFVFMTLQQFQKLKVGDSCYIPMPYKKGQFMSTEILEKDNVFKKLKVLCGGGWKSYRYLQLGKAGQCLCMVGMVKYPKTLWRPQN